MKKTIALLMLLVLIILTQLTQIIKYGSNTISLASRVDSQKIRLIQWQVPPACTILLGGQKQLWPDCLAWRAGGVVTMSQDPTWPDQGVSGTKSLSDNQENGKKTLMGALSYQKGLNQDSVINRVYDILNSLSYAFLKNRQLTFARLGSEGKLVEALTFGQSSSLPAELKEQLRLAGLQHLVSVSSYCFHLTIELLFFLTTKFRTHKKILEILSLGCVAYFVVLIGFPVVLQRTLIALGIDLCSRRFFHRPILPLYRLFLSSLALLLFEPGAFFDVGLQFAVMASLGLLHFHKPPQILSQVCFFLPSRWRSTTIKILWTPIAVQLLTWPLIFYTFGQLSLSSPLACLAVAWILPVILPLGVGYWVVSQFSLDLAMALGQVLRVFIQIFQTELQFMAHWSIVIYFKPDTSLMLLGYCLITFLIYCHLIRRKRYVEQAFFNQLIH